MMRFSRIQSALTAAALLAALPAYSQNAPQNPPAPNLPSTTLTPPGSSVGVPLIPGSTSLPGGALPVTNPPGITPLPMNGPGTPGLYPGLNNSTLPGMGTGSDLTGVLSGTSALPLTLTLGQLDSNWRRMTVAGSLDFGSITQVISSLMGSVGIGVYYTKGQTVTVGGMTYLVAYRTQPQVLNAVNLLQMAQSAAITSTPPTPEKLTPQTPLALSLLNLQTTGSLTDIQPFNLSRELADSAAAVHAYNGFVHAMMLGMTHPSPAHPAFHAPM